MGWNVLVLALRRSSRVSESRPVGLSAEACAPQAIALRHRLLMTLHVTSSDATSCGMTYALTASS
jgi:hypothetical protein